MKAKIQTFLKNIDLRDVAFLLIFLLIVYSFFNAYRKEKDRQENKAETAGLITDQVPLRGRWEVVKYSYYVNDYKYRDTKKIRWSKKNYIGKYFKVYYSSKSPENNIINLNDEIDKEKK